MLLFTVISLYSHEDQGHIHEGMRVFVLREGSRNWTEWDIPP